MEEGFVARANEVDAVLKHQDTSFIVVTTLEPAPLRESDFLIDELRNRSFHLGSVIANRVTPAGLLRDVEDSLGSLQQAIQDPLFVQAVVGAT